MFIVYMLFCHLHVTLLFVADEAEYQALSGKTAAETRFLDARAELDSLLSQIELTSKRLEGMLRKEEEAKKEVETLPTQIEELKSKIEACKSLLFFSKGTLK